MLKGLLKIKGIGYIALALAAGVGLLLLGSADKDTPVPESDRTAAYIKAEEKTLETLAQQLCGVKCKAAVSVSGGYTYTYAADQSVRTVYNPDGSVAEKETTLTEKTVSNGGNTSLVPVKESPPAICGVAVVCGGASLSAVNAVRAMIKALYSLTDEAIFVTN